MAPPSPHAHQSPSKAFLRVRGLRKAYGGREVLRGVEFEAAAGERLALLGPSGSGKSTLLHCLGGVERADGGDIEAGGTSLQTLGVEELARWRRGMVGYVFQFFHLLPTLTAAENVELPLLLAGGWRIADRSARVRELLERAGVAARAGGFPHELSGGERQRVALARALAARPSLLLADEPTGNLDAASGARVLELLCEMTAESGAALVMATHSDLAAATCHRRLRLLDGRVVGEESSPA